MFSVIANIYNKKTKGPTLMEFFTATGKLEKLFFFFLTTRDVRCVHHGWHGIHRYDIQVLATHASTCWLNVNFNVNFNTLLSKYIVHPLVKIKKTLIKQFFIIRRSFLHTQHTIFYHESMGCLAAYTLWLPHRVSG